MQIKQHYSVSDIPKSVWQRLARDAGPFLSYEFLHALETSKSVDLLSDMSSQTGWLVNHIGIWDEDDLVAVIPGFIKLDSYGEYVFDHSWANAYAQYGVDYYPKWISAIPFTPVTGNRILSQEPDIYPVLFEYLKSREDVSSVHWLFCPLNLHKQIIKHGYLPRYSIQFQWQNHNYSSFDDFLARFTSRKRKDIRKERKRVQEKVEVLRVTGQQITQEIQAHFYRCYRQTYLKRSGHEGYLTEAFFNTVFETMRDKIMVVVAIMDDKAIASALFFYDDTGLFGRYWGALRPVDGLHFECCYYQGIEFAIERSLPLFNPGTQGEHKLLRGFEPLVCHSAHHLRDQRFHTAIEDFLQREKPAIARYCMQAKAALPFKQEATEQREEAEYLHPLFTKTNINETENL